MLADADIIGDLRNSIMEMSVKTPPRRAMPPSYYETLRDSITTPLETRKLEFRYGVATRVERQPRRILNRRELILGFLTLAIMKIRGN